MAVYKARIDKVTKVDNRIDISGTLFKDDESFPMPVVSVDIGTTKEEAIEKIKDEIRKFKAGYDTEAELQKYVGTEVKLNGGNSV